MGDVLRDLSALGFAADWTTLSARDVGAPHLRERLWIVAYAVDGDELGLLPGRGEAYGADCGRESRGPSGKRTPAARAAGDVVADPEGERCNEGGGATRSGTRARRA